MESNHLPLENGRVDKSQWSLFVWRDGWLGWYVTLLMEQKRQPVFHWTSSISKWWLHKINGAAFFGAETQDCYLAACSCIAEISCLKSCTSVFPGSVLKRCQLVPVIIKLSLIKVGWHFCIEKKIEENTVLEAFANSWLALVSATNSNMHRVFPPQMAVKHLIGLLWI